MAVPTKSPNRMAQEADAKLLALSGEILTGAQSELYASMRFLDLAISALRPVLQEGLADRGNRRPFATDGASFFYQPSALLACYQRSRILVNRTFLHAVLHCVFCHFAGCRGRDTRLWDLACDIAVEALIDGFSDRALRIPPAPLRRECYAGLQELKVWNAESLYMFLLRESSGSGESALGPVSELEQAFAVDNHCFWQHEKLQNKNSPVAALLLARQKKWQDIRDKMQTALETGDREAGKARGALLSDLRAENRRRYDYREFLRKFAVFHEELSADEDSFDYIYYTLGMQLYGNMPLIEPLETKEVFAIEDFVIVIDTSYSTSGALVHRFLSETYSVLTERNSYFRKVHIRILQCDDRIEDDAVIRSKEEMEAYMQSFRLIGQGGTDFRPAFAYVDGLIQKRAFRRLRGLIYFTDGKGIYPLRRPPYETAFVFLEHAYDDLDVPAWAMKLILPEDAFSDK